MQADQHNHDIAIARPPATTLEHLKLHVVHALKSYLAFHFAGFVIVSLLGGMVIALVDNISYVDGLFMATSALCVTGLSVLDMSQVNRAAQVILLLMSILGSTAVISVIPLLIRSAIIKKRAKDISEQTRVELSSMLRIIVVVPVYMLVHILFGFVAGGLYTQFTDDVRPTLEDAHVSPWYASLFLSITAFSNSGLTPFASGLAGYAKSRFLLLLYVYLILAGNTAFPIILRLMLSIRKWLSSWFEHGNEEYQYTLEHPRRIYTHLFHAKSTLRLLGALVLLNVMQWANMMIFDWNRSLSSLPSSLKILNALFQSVSTRAAGFNTLDLTQEAPPVQVMQIVMMYLSALPVALAIRSSTEEAWSPVETTDTKRGFLSMLRHTLQRDLLVLVIAYYFISIVERNRIDDVEPGQAITQFRILYEIVSAYGTVGLSLSAAPQSLSGFLRPLSRLVLVCVMLSGRHRGLGLLMPSAFRYSSV